MGSGTVEGANEAGPIVLARCAIAMTDYSSWQLGFFLGLSVIEGGSFIKVTLNSPINLG